MSAPLPLNPLRADCALTLRRPKITTIRSNIAQDGLSSSEPLSILVSMTYAAFLGNKFLLEQLPDSMRTKVRINPDKFVEAFEVMLPDGSLGHAEYFPACIPHGFAPPADATVPPPPNTHKNGDPKAHPEPHDHNPSRGETFEELPFSRSIPLFPPGYVVPSSMTRGPPPTRDDGDHLAALKEWDELTVRHARSIPACALAPPVLLSNAVSPDPVGSRSKSESLVPPRPPALKKAMLFPAKSSGPRRNPPRKPVANTKGMTTAC